MTTKADTRAPVRKIGKQEAIRHLIHCAVRMVAAQEDPFAIHLLIHSAEKMLMDVAKQAGKKLTFNWADYVEGPAFFRFHRATYNFFKHADKDFDQELPVPEIARMNVAFLYVCCDNYRKLFDDSTEHVLLMIELMQVLAPEIFHLPEPEAHQKHIEELGNATLAEFFTEGFKPNPMFPALHTEKAADLRDNGNLFDTPIPVLRATGLKGE